jgi:lipid-A-disaccharide synthase
MSRGDLLVVAGEPSGDLHASRLVRGLLARRPSLRAFGLGSDELRAAGVELVADSREIAVVGIVEAWSVLARAREIFAALLAEVDRRRPPVAVLVDFPDFNLRLARALRRRGVRVVYYVSPQIWAWRRWRVRAIAGSVDRMLVLFPFEEAFYRRAGVAALHVGHPLVDEVPRLPQAWDSVAADALPRRYRLALLPGSRESELAALLPVMLAAARELASRLPVDVMLIRAAAIDARDLERRVAAGAGELAVEIVSGDRYRAIASAHLALCASGTATLETGLIGTPLVVVYRLSRLTWWLARLLVRVPHASLVNLVLGRAAVPELLQAAARPQRVADEAERLLRSRPAIDAMRAGLAELRDRLGSPGASQRAAEAVLELLPEGERAA